MDSAPPEFSVIIPSRDRAGQLRTCLAAIARIACAKDAFEVIVVDDGSRDPYEPVVAPFARAMYIRLLRRGGDGPAQARNAGVHAARGRFVALIDDDCTPEPDWLPALARVLRESPDALVGGRIVNVLRDNPFSEASQLLVSYLYDYFGSGVRETRFFASCNLAMSAELYRQSGGFDARFTMAGGEDRDFCDRWFASGRRVAYAPDAAVLHAHPLSLRSFVRQHFHYGRGAWHFHRARMDRGLAKVRMEPVSFLGGMLARPFHDGVRRPLLVSLLLGVSVGVNAFGYYRERLRSPAPAAARSGQGTALPEPAVAGGSETHESETETGHPLHSTTSKTD